MCPYGAKLTASRSCEWSEQDYSNEPTSVEVWSNQSPRAIQKSKTMNAISQSDETDSSNLFNSSAHTSTPISRSLMVVSFLNKHPCWNPLPCQPKVGPHWACARFQHSPPPIRPNILHPPRRLAPNMYMLLEGLYTPHLTICSWAM